MPTRVGLQCLSLDHQQADVATRGLLACPATDAGALLADPARPRADAFVLSTCNRIELYWVGDGAMAEWWAARSRGLGASAAFAHYRGAEAARHLIRVASGLESRMLGEREILGQVRAAVHAAREAGALGRRLGPVADGAIAAARRVRSGSLLERHARAASAAMVDWAAAQTGGSLAGCSALVLGAGQAAEGALRALLERQARRVVLVNRNRERAEALARGLPGVVVASWDDLGALARAADVIVAATAAREPVLRAAHFAPLPPRTTVQPVHVLDLGVPPNVDHAARRLSGVRVTDLDALKAACCTAADAGTAALDEADAQVEREVRALARDLRVRRQARVLAHLHRVGAAVAAEEAEALLAERGGGTDDERRALHAFGERLARRMLYRISKALRDGPTPGMRPRLPAGV